jgi:hypothetical protein
MRKLLVVFFALFVVAAPAGAQDKPVSINVGGGVLFPLGGFKDAFNTGWLGGIGATFNVSPTLGVQAEYMYNWMPGPEKTITVFPTPGGGVGSNQLIESNHSMHSVTFNMMFKPAAASDSRLGGYFVAGPGIYHRSVELTSPSVGYASVCDPYWYYCYPALVSVDRIIGSRSSTDFGINFGGGVTFGGESAKFYVEMRYHYVWGPEVNPQVNNALPGTTLPSDFSTNAQYFPIVFGVTW